MKMKMKRIYLLLKIFLWNVKIIIHLLMDSWKFNLVRVIIKIISIE
jgi:hypothetical protein